MADPRLFPSGSDERRDASGRRLYSPYQDLNIPYKQLYDLPTSPEFLFQEEAIAQRRSWGENLTYYTGIGYLAGAVGGAALGLGDAVRGAEPGERPPRSGPTACSTPAAAPAAASVTSSGSLVLCTPGSRAPWSPSATRTTGSTASPRGSARARSSAPPTARAPPSSRAPSGGSSPVAPRRSSRSARDTCRPSDAFVW